MEAWEAKVAAGSDVVSVGDTARAVGAGSGVDVVLGGMAGWASGTELVVGEVWA